MENDDKREDMNKKAREIVDEAIKLVGELHPFTEIIETVAGCTISSHCGPCCLGVLFFKK